MSLQTTRTIYRVSTILLALFLISGAFSAESAQSIERMAHVGLADAKRLQYIITYAPVLGILAIIIPQVPNRLKERAYAGLSFIYIGAFIAHILIDGFVNPLTYAPLVALTVVMISYAMWHKLLGKKQHNIS